MYAFTGSRKLPETFRSPVHALVGEFTSQGHLVGVGCAQGLDSFVRESCDFSGRVFTAESGVSYALVRRSVFMVDVLCTSATPCLIAFPDKDCPPELVPQASWQRPVSALKCFCGSGSGSWATAAYAAGRGAALYVGGLSACQLPPAWGSWVLSSRFPGLRRLVPAPSPQLSLFSS